MVVTRAIGVDAPPEAVWPWLMQLGQRRGGWYSYDKISSLTCSEPVVSATEIDPELQNLKVGDAVYLVDRVALNVAELEENHALVLHVDGHNVPAQPYSQAWAFVVEAEGPTGSRLLVRETYGWNSAVIGLTIRLIDWINFVMTRKMLKNLRTLAKDHAAQQHLDHHLDQHAEQAEAR
jgi:hypothetical protein